jgi:hypothetical protein
MLAGYGGSMNAEDFDRVTTRFAELRLSRRNALARGGAGIAGATLAAAGVASIRAEDATPEAGQATPQAESVHPNAGQENPEFLFVQAFEGGTYTPTDEEGLFKLTLTGASSRTNYFSDRPDRVFGLTPTASFLEGLGFTPENPPNAALVVETESGQKDVLILELFNPVYDEATSTLTYDVRLLSDYQGEGLAYAALQQIDFDLDSTFGKGGLFVDGCADGRIYCHQRNADGSMGPFVGTSPFTPFCFDLSTSRCLPCSGANAICAAAFPAQCLDRTISPPRSRCGARGITWP